MARKTSVEKIRDGLKRAVQHEAGARTLTTRDVELPERPEPMTPAQIVRLRRDKLRVSQAVFAGLLNSSVQTIHAWEQGRTRPSGCALRFLRMIDSNPRILGEMIESA